MCPISALSALQASTVKSTRLPSVNKRTDCFLGTAEKPIRSKGKILITFSEEVYPVIGFRKNKPSHLSSRGGPSYYWGRI